MLQKINPTRIELIRLRSKLKRMENGYKLLKKKRDGLMKEFINIIRKIQGLREKIDRETRDAFKFFIFASSEMRSQELEQALSAGSRELILKINKKNIMGKDIPIFDLQERGDLLCYSPISTSPNLDIALLRFSDILKQTINLAQMENAAIILSKEIEKIRREVNALEYVYIPEIKKTIKYIFSKLDERERLNTVILMKSKEKLMSA